jgi:hypothetical protein
MPSLQYHFLHCRCAWFLNLAHLMEIKPPFAKNSVRFLLGCAAGRHRGF